MRRTVPRALALVAMACCVASVGCEEGGGLHRRRDPGTLVVARAADVQLLDPARALDIESIEVGTLLFDGLVRWAPGEQGIEPALAETWRTSPDHLVWTFHLRPDVVFHDGTPVDAAAVVFSFDRLLRADHPHYLGGEDPDYWRLLIKDVIGVAAISPRIVQIRVRQPFAPLLGYLAIFPIVSPAAVARSGDAFQERPVGAGPFQLEEWRPGDALVLRRFERYWGERPVLARIVFRVLADARQRLVELESGSVDLAMAIAPDEQSFVELHPDLRLYRSASNDVSYLAFNLSRPPFGELAVRRGIAHAINKKPIVKLAFQGHAREAEGPLPPTQWGRHVPESPRYPFDPERARELLRTAAERSGFDPDATYTLYAPATPRPYLTWPERVAQCLQASLANVGVKTELRLLPYRQYREAVQAGEHDLALFGWLGDTGDPDNFLYVLFHSDNAVPGAAHNVAFFRDPVVDQLLTAARSVTDQASRAARYREVQERISEEAPWVPIAHSEYVIAARKEIADVMMSPLGRLVYSKISREGPR